LCSSTCTIQSRVRSSAERFCKLTATNAMRKNAVTLAAQIRNIFLNLEEFIAAVWQTRSALRYCLGNNSAWLR